MAGMNGDQVAKILGGVMSAKFGPGAIGRIGTIAKAGLVVLGLTAIVFAFVNIWAALTVAFLIVFFGFYCVHRAFSYAEKHPEISAMDGAQVAKVIQQQGSMRQLEGVPPPPPVIVGEVVENPLIANHREEGR